MNLPSPCVVLLVGPGASGKSTWAASHFPPDTVVSSDRLRALVGTGEDDIAASTDAFALLEEIVRRRLARRLTTVIDTLGLAAAQRSAWLALARSHDLPCVAVAFDTPAAECRARNRQRTERIPADVLTQQLRSFQAVRSVLATEGYDAVLTPSPVRVVPPAFVSASAAALGYLAACTSRVQLGALVTGVTYRNVGHLGKIVATLDVLSGGRAGGLRSRAGVVQAGA